MKNKRRNVAGSTLSRIHWPRSIPTKGINIALPDLVSEGDGQLQAPASALMHKSRTMVQTWRRIMKALIAALALATLIAVPTFAQPAIAAPVSPASSSFGSNGY